MGLRRLQTDALPEDGGEVWLSAEVTHHARVLRLRRGDRLLLQDGTGRVAEATVLEIVEGRLSCRVERPTALEQPTPLVLLLCPPKVARLDDCLRAAVEVGATRIELVTSEYTVVQAEQLQARRARLERIVSEAARQSEHAHAIALGGPRPLSAALAEVPQTATKLCLHARSTALPHAIAPGEAWVAIGPEGGFSPAELEGFAAAGFVEASLPTGILRVETAVPVALAVVRTLQALATQGGKA